MKVRNCAVVQWVMGSSRSPVERVNGVDGRPRQIFVKSEILPIADRHPSTFDRHQVHQAVNHVRAPSLARAKSVLIYLQESQYQCSDIQDIRLHSGKEKKNRHIFVPTFTLGYFHFWRRALSLIPSLRKERSNLGLLCAERPWSNQSYDTTYVYPSILVDPEW